MAVGWQEVLLQSLEARDQREQAYVPFIHQYQRLAQSTALLKERNDVLLSAAKSARGSGKGKEASSGTGDDNPVRAAYVTSLESQISSLKEELAGLYRTQSQNAQRLLSLTDSLRDKEDEARQESDQRKSLKSEMDRTQRRCQDLEASLKEKENMIVHLNDELQTAQLEFTQLEARNQDLTKDNKNLLQRWLNKMSSEVDQMNEANAFMESTKKSDNGKTPRATSRPTTPERGRRTPNTSTTSHKSSASSKRPATPKLPPSRLPATDSST